MSDCKFTDDEIIHSLKICMNDSDCSECIINPHKGNYGYCTSIAIKAALDLINRQKAELEDLREIVFMDRSEAIKNLKAEAIKEFAERLKPKLSYYDEVYVDTLVKEMTEANDGKEGF